MITHEPTKSWNRFFIWGPVLGLGPRGPQNWKIDSSYSFLARTFIFSEIICYPWTNKMMKIFFLFGARFGARPQKGPKIEILTPPTIFLLGPSFFQGLLVTHEPTISWNGFFIWGPVLGLGPKGPQNWKMDSSYSFWARTFIVSGIIGYPWTNKIWNRYFIWGPVLGQAPKGPQNWKMDSSYSF